MRIRRPRRVTLVVGGLLAAGAIAGVAAVSAIDPAAYRDTLEKRASAATGRTVQIGGDMALSMAWRPGLTLHDLRIANPDWAARDSFLRADKAALDVALLPLLWGEVRLHRVALDAPRVNLARGPDGARTWELGGGAGDAATKNTRMLGGLERLRVRDARLSYRAGADAPERTARLRRLTAKPAADQRLRVRGEARVQGTRIRVDGEVGKPAQAFTANHPYPVALTLRALGAKLRVDGTVIEPAEARRLDLALTLRSEDSSGIAARLGLPEPPDARLTASAKLEGKPGHFALREISARLGESRLTGRARLAWLDAPLEVRGTLTAQRLDLRPYLRRGREGDGAADNAQRVFPDTPLPWHLLRRGRADVALTVDALKLWHDLTVRDIETRVTLKDGTLRLRDLEARMAGGSLSGELTADASTQPPAVDAELRGDSLAYGRTLAEFDLTDGVTGRADVEASLASTGRTAHALAAATSGKIAVTGGQGRVDNALLEAAGTGLADLLAPWRATSSDMRLTCAVARLQAESGQLDSRVLLADTPSATLGGEGRIDLARERYDLRLVPKAKQTSLMSLAVPVRITGPLRQPAIAPDAAGAAKAGAIAVGSLVNPLLTLGALVVDSRTNEGNPCVAALRKAREKAAQQDESDGETGVGGFFENLSRSIDDALGGKASHDEDDDPLLHGGGKQHGR